MRFAVEADKEQRHDVEQMERDSLCMVSKTGHGATDSSTAKSTRWSFRKPTFVS